MGTGKASRKLSKSQPEPTDLTAGPSDRPAHVGLAEDWVDPVAELSPSGSNSGFDPVPLDILFGT